MRADLPYAHEAPAVTTRVDLPTLALREPLSLLGVPPRPFEPRDL